jgi:hypothetical protein
MMHFVYHDESFHSELISTVIKSKTDRHRFTACLQLIRQKEIRYSSLAQEEERTQIGILHLDLVPLNGTGHFIM